MSSPGSSSRRGHTAQDSVPSTPTRSNSNQQEHQSSPSVGSRATPRVTRRAAESTAATSSPLFYSSSGNTPREPPQDASSPVNGDRETTPRAVPLSGNGGMQQKL